MFIRKATTRISKSGKTGYTYRLCHNTRTGDLVRQKILLNLGTYFTVEQEYWQPLCERIKVLLSGQTEMGFAASLPIHVEAAAQWIVAKLSKKTEKKVKEREEARKKQEKKEKAQQKQKPEAPWPSVDPAQDSSASRTVGVEHVKSMGHREVGAGYAPAIPWASPRDAKDRTRTNCGPHGRTQ